MYEKELEQIKQAACHFLPDGAFIAGGALTAVFTGQPINDVDIYFKSQEAFIAAVEQAYRINGKKKCKFYSVNVRGEDEAFRLACEWRAKMIEEMNSQGAGYTEMHGESK